MEQISLRLPGEHGPTLIEIVEAMEGPLAMTECSQHESHCGIAHQCGARANWRLIGHGEPQANIVSALCKAAASLSTSAMVL